MARHRPKFVCTYCGRRRVAARGMLCFACQTRIPGLPERPPAHPMVRPVAKNPGAVG
jgi:hypothetical protein